MKICLISPCDAFHPFVVCIFFTSCCTSLFFLPLSPPLLVCLFIFTLSFCHPRLRLLSVSPCQHNACSVSTSISPVCIFHQLFSFSFPFPPHSSHRSPFRSCMSSSLSTVPWGLFGVIVKPVMSPQAAFIIGLRGAHAHSHALPQIVRCWLKAGRGWSFREDLGLRALTLSKCSPLCSEPVYLCVCICVWDKPHMHFTCFHLHFVFSRCMHVPILLFITACFYITFHPCGCNLCLSVRIPTVQ